MNQFRQHSIESAALSKLETYFANRGFDFERASKEDDILKGTDFYLSNKPFDLKASDSGKLSLLRRTARRGWYCPLTDHPSVDYAYLYKGALHLINRALLLANIDSILNNPEVSFGSYSGDGNIQKWIDLSKILPEISYEIFLID